MSNGKSFLITLVIWIAAMAAAKVVVGHFTEVPDSFAWWAVYGSFVSGVSYALTTSGKGK